MEHLQELLKFHDTESDYVLTATFCCRPSPSYNVVQVSIESMTGVEYGYDELVLMKPHTLATMQNLNMLPVSVYFDILALSRELIIKVLRGERPRPISSSQTHSERVLASIPF